MNKNYYEILQINQNASPEIIDKAYKTLAKKYHPDLQEEINKKQAEEILKEINEAYETLSNPDKKALYDQNLKNEAISQEDYDEIYDYGNEQEHVIAKRKYRITLYTLSEEFYKYLKSINDQQNNDLSNSELAPMRITYTNVNRGLGIVGGCRLIRTEWIDNLQEDETSKTISCVDEIN